MAEYHAAKGDQTPYVCGECGEPVFVIPPANRVVRPCGHDSAAIVANMEALATGSSSLA